MIDKESVSWQAEPWYIRLLLWGIRRRSHMLAIEYILIIVGIAGLFMTAKNTSAAAFLAAYINVKLLNYIDQRAYW